MNVSLAPCFQPLHCIRGWLCALKNGFGASPNVSEDSIEGRPDACLN